MREGPYNIWSKYRKRYHVPISGITFKNRRAHDKYKGSSIMKGF
jgi:hypothetical protein